MIASALLNPDEVAKSLDIKPIEAQRLLARRRLAYYPQPDGLKPLVDPSAITEYQRRGQPDRRMPKGHAGWFATDDVYAGYGVRDNLNRLIEKEVGSNPRPPKSERAVSVEVRRTPAMYSVIEAVVSAHQVSARNGTPGPSRRIDLYLAGELRNQVKSILVREQLKHGSGGYLDRLYRNSDAYDALINRAWALLMDRGPAIERRFAGIGTANRTVYVRYSFRWKQIGLESRKNSVTAFAF